MLRYRRPLCTEPAASVRRCNVIVPPHRAAASCRHPSNPVHPRPSLAPASQALALEFGERLDSTDGGAPACTDLPGVPDSTFYEITIATVDQPKLLSRLSDAMVGAGMAGWGVGVGGVWVCPAVSLQRETAARWSSRGRYSKRMG